MYPITNCNERQFFKVKIYTKWTSKAGARYNHEKLLFWGQKLDNILWNKTELDCIRKFERIEIFILRHNSMAKFLVLEKGANPNLRWKKFPYTLMAQAMPYQYEPDEGLIRFWVSSFFLTIHWRVKDEL